MMEPESLLQDTVLRVLEVSPRGLTVERICTQLTESGATISKHEIVRALGRLNQRQLVQIGASRRWHTRHHVATGGTGRPQSESPKRPDEYMIAVPCQAIGGEVAAPDPEIPPGDIDASINLLKQLMPYYQEALRAGDGGSPQGYANQYGDSFLHLEPDAAWWPTAGQGRTLIVPLNRVPQGMRSLLAKQNSKHVLLGYPLHLISPLSGEGDSFVRPVSVFRCGFDQTDTHLRISVPAVKPTVSRDWLRDQVKYGGWNSSRLLSWLLIEDEAAGIEEDDEVETPEFLEIPVFAARVQSAAGKALHQKLLPDAVAGRVPRSGPTGYYNGLALFAENSGKYVRSAINDYDRLCQEPTERLQATSLEALFGGTGHTLTPPPILHPFPMGETQLVATRAALSGPLTVITGPPGTGKSQVIASIMVSAAAAGRSVLLAARQHRAIDAVQERLEALTGDRVLLVRANEAEGYTKFTFPDAIRALQARAGDQEAVKRYERRQKPLEEVDTLRWTLLEAWRKLKVASEDEGALLAELEKLAVDRTRLAGSPVEPATIAKVAKPLSPILRFLAWLLRLPASAGISLGAAFRHDHFNREESRLKSALTEIEGRIKILRAEIENHEDTPVSLSLKIEALCKEVIEPLLDRLDAVTTADRQKLTAIAGDAGLMGHQGVGVEAYLLILKHMPLWAVTTLAAGSRIPLEAGLFDYVVFDEAGITDIASAIPLLFRAKAAVIVGDPMQLGMISNLESREERLLLNRFNLLRAGVGRFAQGQTDLYQLAASAIRSAPFLLNEHYRCHPDIASYFNEAFYGRRLVALTDTQKLRVPKGFKPGLHWTDVQGTVSTGRTIGADGSAYSDAEADAVVAQLKALIAQDFQGSVGVVTFFAPQAMRINQLAGKEIGAAALDRMGVKVFTANKFQGDERDVMLMSLCLAPDMPVGARSFLMREKRLLNVAVSRARAICHVFGNKDYAKRCGIPHIETLVRRVDASATGRVGRFDDRFDSPWEKMLYDALVARGHSPIVQHPIAGRFLDLALIDEDRTPPQLIDIEVDGVAYHTDADRNRLATDLWRDHQLKALGWRVLRFWVYELRDDMEGCLERINQATGG